MPRVGFFSFPRSLVELGPCKAPHAVCDGDVDFPAPVVDGRIDHLVEHPYPVVGRCISDRLEKMLPAGEQRAVIAGGIGTSRGQPFGFGPRVKTAIDKSTLPEVILKWSLAIRPTMTGILRRIILSSLSRFRFIISVKSFMSIIISNSRIIYNFATEASNMPFMRYEYTGTSKERGPCTY